MKVTTAGTTPVTEVPFVVGGVYTTPSTAGAKPQVRILFSTRGHHYMFTPDGITVMATVSEEDMCKFMRLYNYTYWPAAELVVK